MKTYVINVKVVKKIEYSYDLHVIADTCEEAAKKVKEKGEEELSRVVVPSSKMKITAEKITLQCKGEYNG